MTNAEIIRIDNMFDMNRVAPRKVFDRFLNRYQIRIITDWEYVILMQPNIQWYKDNTGFMPDILAIGRLVSPAYGEKSWA